MSRRTIGGVKVTQRVSPRVRNLMDGVLSLQRAAVSEVVEQSASLALDDPRDRAILVKRIRYALGLDT